MVSVIIPVYNGEKYIGRCLDGMLNGDPSRLEIIAVNDGSRDNSLEILREYEKKLSFLQVLDKENGGAASARKAGLSLARGEYVAFLDVDDESSPEMYYALEEKAIKGGADIVFCDYTEVSENGSKRVGNIFSENESFPISGERATYLLHTRKAVFPFPWNKIYRRELMDKIEYPEGNFVGEDYYMLLRLFEIAERVEYADASDYRYELTENSASRKGFGEWTRLAYSHFKENREYVRSRYPYMSKEVDNYVTTEYMACIIAMGRNRTYDRKMIKEIKHFVRGNLLNYISAGYVPAVMKGSAAVLSVSSRLLILAYKIIK